MLTGRDWLALTEFLVRSRTVILFSQTKYKQALWSPTQAPGHLTAPRPHFPAVWTEFLSAAQPWWHLSATVFKWYQRSQIREDTVEHSFPVCEINPKACMLIIMAQVIWPLWRIEPQIQQTTGQAQHVVWAFPLNHGDRYFQLSLLLKMWAVYDSWVWQLLMIN